MNRRISDLPELAVEDVCPHAMLPISQNKVSYAITVSELRKVINEPKSYWNRRIRKMRERHVCQNSTEHFTEKRVYTLPSRKGTFGTRS